MDLAYKDLAVYIHIPFCAAKCNYCNFNSARPCGNQVDEYIQALKEEIISMSRLAGEYTVKTVFIGGGTPSFIAANYIVDILDIIKSSFELVRKGAYCPYEITIECNPGTVDYDKLLSYRQAGVNRISIGLQSADNEELNILGRIHNYEQWLNTVKNARKAGFDNINTDLISGIPGQTCEKFAKSLHAVVDAGVEHISVYSLIVEEGTPFYDIYREELYSDDELDRIEEEDRRIYEMTGRLLADSGYSRYEISNYAKEGMECEHNLVYWNRGDYIGFGISAASLINNVRLQNTDSIDEYIAAPLKAMRHREKLSLKDRMSECMMLGLRKIAGVSCEEFLVEFGEDIYDVYGNIIEYWRDKGYLICEAGRIRCSEEGLNICNRIMVDFILE